jgi:hypothetical protein
VVRQAVPPGATVHWQVTSRRTPQQGRMRRAGSSAAVGAGKTSAGVTRPDGAVKQRRGDLERTISAVWLRLAGAAAQRRSGAAPPVDARRIDRPACCAACHWPTAPHHGRSRQKSSHSVKRIW